jgi:hypothetical protein
MLRLNPGDGIAIGQLGRRANWGPFAVVGGRTAKRGSGNSMRIAEFDGDVDAKMDAMVDEIIKYREGEPVPLADLPQRRRGPQRRSIGRPRPQAVARPRGSLLAEAEAQDLSEVVDARRAASRANGQKPSWEPRAANTRYKGFGLSRPRARSTGTPRSDLYRAASARMTEKGRANGALPAKPSTFRSHGLPQ